VCGTCITHEANEKCMHNLVRKFKKKEKEKKGQVEGLGVEGNIKVNPVKV
jgi:hypothetical protein